MLQDFQNVFDSAIKLNELYYAVENVLHKNFSFLQDKQGNVAYRLSTYRM